MTDTLYRWVKASERKPEARVITKWLHGGDPGQERIDILGKEQIESFSSPSEIESIEWLEPYTPYLNAGSLEQAAHEYAIGMVDEQGGTFNHYQDGFLAGAAYVKPDIEKVVRELREANPWKVELGKEFGSQGKGWNECVVYLKELLNAPSQSPQTPIPIEPEGGRDCICQNCGESYETDYLVSDETWAMISPKKVDGFKSGGLLCGKCIISKLEHLLKGK